MTLDDVLRDIEGLIGLNLRSISGKASSFVITKIDRKNRRIHITMDSGKDHTRPLSEIENVWRALVETPAVHVDSDVLKGSGSMRNQPETIFANLPYIEYLQIDGKKRLVLIPTRTHHPGTLQQMDPIRGREVIERYQKRKDVIPPPTMLFVAGDISADSRIISSWTCIDSLPIESTYGLYRFYGKLNRVLVTKIDGIPRGAYPVVFSPVKISGTPLFSVDGYDLIFCLNNGCRVIFAVQITA